MRIYLASNYSTFPEMQKHATVLSNAGHYVTSEWISGTHQADDHAQYAEIDLRNINDAEAVIFWSESPKGSRTRGGKHVEFGYALATGKQLFIVGPCANVFHHLPQVIQRHHFEDVLALLGTA